MNLAKKLLGLFERQVKVGDQVTIVSHEGPGGVPNPCSNKSGEVVSIEGEMAKVKLDSGEETMVKVSVLIPFGEAKEKSPVICHECGAHFKKSIGPGTYEIKCPRCGSYDTEPE